MIFVTIGTVFPFDRLIQSMDDWAGTEGNTPHVLAQIGRGANHPKNLEWHASQPGEGNAHAVAQASVIVSHAGMGTAISAMLPSKPLVMLPRRFEAGEHNTNHQMATARWLAEKPGVFIAWDETELAERIDEALVWTGAGTALKPVAPKDFTDRLAAQLERWTRA